jgi:hypothetical protein
VRGLAGPLPAGLSASWESVDEFNRVTREFSEWMMSTDLTNNLPGAHVEKRKHNTPFVLPEQPVDTRTPEEKKQYWKLYWDIKLKRRRDHNEAAQMFKLRHAIRDQAIAALPTPLRTSCLNLVRAAPLVVPPINMFLLPPRPERFKYKD